MKKLLHKLNYSFLFYSIAILLLLLLFPSIKNNFVAEKNEGLKQFQDFKNLVHLPTFNNNRVYSYDPSFKLEYSFDGGDTYFSFDTLRPENLFRNNLFHYALSQRSLPIEAKLPELPTVLVKGRHEKQAIFIEEFAVLFSNKKNHSLPILNIISAEDGLFSDQQGIMVLGHDAWIESGFYKPFWEKNANYKRRGEESKRKAIFQWIKKDKIVYENTCDFQISGNATRAFPQKSFKLKINKAFGSSLFKYKFFGKKGLKKYESLVIRSGGNDNTKTLFADALMHELAKNTAVLVQKSKACVVYINGNYWGLYNLRERISTFFIGEYENAKPEEITILEGGHATVKDGEKKKRKEFVNLVDEENSYSVICDRIDMNSFVDYILLETFYGNGDWLHNNAIWYQVSGGKWKWMLNDLDYGLTYTGVENVNKNYFKAIVKSNTVNARLYKKLLRQKEFVELLQSRGNSLLETNFSDAVIEKVFYKKMNAIEAEIPLQIKRWRGVLTTEDWKINAYNNLDFLKKRKEIFLDQLNQIGNV